MVNMAVPKVLIACEESQAVCIAMREVGAEAYSCDIQGCSGGHPEWHIKGDVLKIINGGCEFVTSDGWTHIVPRQWDMIIAHPPCTDLAVSGARHFAQKQKDGRQQKSIVFFMELALARCDRVAVENPVCIMSSAWRKPDQIIQPYMFGDPHKKTTCLWLKGLTKLIPTKMTQPTIVEYTCRNGKTVRFDEYMVRGMKEGRAKHRSKTFPGVAKAMAEQWGKPLVEEMSKNETD